MIRNWSGKLKQLFIAISLLFSSFFIGVIGFMLIEGRSLGDAIYLTIILVSTIGMNEVGKISEAGRVFISFFAIFNLSVFAYAISVITKYVFEGELKDIFNQYMTTRVGDKMKDHVIVCGHGKDGKKVCEELFYSGVPFTIVALKTQKAYEKYKDSNKVHMVEGDATQDEILIKAGIDRAKTIITTLPTDSDNVFVTLTARGLNAQLKIIAKASEESTERKLMRAGANNVVMPDAIGGAHMANLVTHPEVVEFLGMLNGVGNTELQLSQMSFEDFREDYHNKSIKDLDMRNNTGVNIVGYKDASDDFIFNPTPDTVLQEGDVMIILGTFIEIRTCKSFYGTF